MSDFLKTRNTSISWTIKKENVLSLIQFPVSSRAGMSSHRSFPADDPGWKDSWALGGVHQAVKGEEEVGEMRA